MRSQLCTDNVVVIHIESFAKVQLKDIKLVTSANVFGGVIDGRVIVHKI